MAEDIHGGTMWQSNAKLQWMNNIEFYCVTRVYTWLHKVLKTIGVKTKCLEIRSFKAFSMNVYDQVVGDISY